MLLQKTAENNNSISITEMWKENKKQTNFSTDQRSVLYIKIFAQILRESTQLVPTSVDGTKMTCKVWHRWTNSNILQCEHTYKLKKWFSDYGLSNAHWKIT